jgi:hypothetical protein
MSNAERSEISSKDFSPPLNRPHSKSSTLTCVTTGGMDCEKCNLNDVLQCKFTKRETIGFIIVNTCYRLSILAIFYIIGVMLNTWWMMWAYGLFVALTFFVIEPLLICSHCPFYAQEGKFLTCGGLWGIPKFWKYQLEPITKWNKTVMLVVGGFFEVIPFLGIVGGIILFLNDPHPHLFYGIGLIITSFIVIGLGYYTLKVLLGDRCKRCPNFSCPLNKVPADYVHLFLMKNIPMREAWKEAGWHLESV